jgi:hypothetical protein
MNTRTREARDRERTELARAEGRELLSWVQGAPRVVGFDVEGDGSPVLWKAHKRLAEMAEDGVGDKGGRCLYEALLAHEVRGLPLIEACEEWLREVGEPEEEDWERDDWDDEEDWREEKW